jgi:dTDP-glucose pyrophosphorylase
VADVRPYLLRGGDSLLDALARVNANRRGVGIVVDGGREVLGTVSDGDIRRALMQGSDPASPVSAVMTKKLTRLSRLPVEVVAKGGTVVDVVPRPLDGPAPVAMVMAGGRGKRLRPYTDKVPKPLLKVGDSTIIERIMADLAAAGVSDIYLALNYKAKMFERRLAHVEEHVGARVHFLLEDSPLGTAGALSLLPSRPAGDVLVTNADIVTRLQYARLFEYHRAHAGWATMTAVDHVTQIPYGVLRTRGDRLTAQEEKPEVRVRCNAGMYVLAPEVLKLVKRNQYLDMPTLLDRVSGADHAVHVFPVVEKWIDSGTPEEFERVLIQFATGEEE